MGKIGRRPLRSVRLPRSQEFLIREFAPPRVEAGIGLLSRSQLGRENPAATR